MKEREWKWDKPIEFENTLWPESKMLFFFFIILVVEDVNVFDHKSLSWGFNLGVIISAIYLTNVNLFSPSLSLSSFTSLPFLSTCRKDTREREPNQWQEQTYQRLAEVRELFNTIGEREREKWREAKKVFFREKTRRKKPKKSVQLKSDTRNLNIEIAHWDRE